MTITGMDAAAETHTQREPWVTNAKKQHRNSHARKRNESDSADENCLRARAQQKHGDQRHTADSCYRIDRWIKRALQSSGGNHQDSVKPAAQGVRVKIRQEVQQDWRQEA